jgi:hypothetical protein
MDNRRLPASVEAERSILGTILLDNLAYSQAAEQLHPDDFSLDAHRRIYSCMMDLARSSQPIDLILLVEALSCRKELDVVGNVGYVSGLLDGVPDRPSIEHYVRIVKEKALLRALLHAADNTISRARGGDESGEQLLAASEGELRTIAEKYRYATESTRIHTWEQIPTLDQLPTADVSWLVEGMVPVGSIALWAGKSGSYKTWLSLCLAKAVHDGRDFLGRKTIRTPVLYLDRENPLPLIRERCSILEIHSSEDFRLWGGWQSDPPPMICDRRLLEIARNAQPLIIVDSFIRFHGADENSATEMARVMADLRSLANAGATLLLQHHKPKAEGAQYRGSSDIKAGIDVGFSITYEKEQTTVTIQCFKNRFGEEATIRPGPRFRPAQASRRSMTTL